MIHVPDSKEDKVQRSNAENVNDDQATAEGVQSIKPPAEVVNVNPQEDNKTKESNAIVAKTSETADNDDNDEDGGSIQNNEEEISHHAAANDNFSKKIARDQGFNLKTSDEAESADLSEKKGFLFKEQDTPDNEIDNRGNRSFHANRSTPTTEEKPKNPQAYNFKE